MDSLARRYGGAGIRRGIRGSRRRVSGPSGPAYLLDYADATYTRSGEAAAVDASFEFYDTVTPWVAANVPRILPDGSILIEGSRTNLVVDGREYDAAGWSSFGGTPTITNDVEAGPDGLTTADRVEVATGTIWQRTSQTGLTLSGSYVASAYIRARDPGDTAHFGLTDNGTNFAYSGTSSTAFERHWVRIASFAATTGQVRLGDGSDRSSVGGLTAGARDMIADLVQLEAGSFASSPIRTTGAIGTRGGSACYFPSAAWSSITELSAGAYDIDFTPTYDSADVMVAGTIIPIIGTPGGADFVRLRNPAGAAWNVEFGKSTGGSGGGINGVSFTAGTTYTLRVDLATGLVTCAALGGSQAGAVPGTWSTASNLLIGTNNTSPTVWAYAAIGRPRAIA